MYIKVIRNILLVFIALFLIKTLISYISIFYGSIDFTALFYPDKFKTDPANKYHLQLNYPDYLSDVNKASRILRGYVFTNEYPFEDKEIFDRDTKIFIDTIVYSPDKKKLAVLLISITPNEKFGYNPDIVEKYYINKKYTYNLNCYVGIKKNNSIDLRLVRSIMATNNVSLEKSRVSIRKYYFEALSLMVFEGEKMVNIDDKRFWELSIWKNLFKK